MTAQLSLDIGTRSVVGLLSDYDNQKLYVKDIEIREYKTRAMYDGQIHDIHVVGQDILAVKEAFEDRHQIELSSAGVALAGRSLVTHRFQMERAISPDIVLDPKILSEIEHHGISKILADFKQEYVSDQPLQCVGYSVVHYELDGLPLKQVVGHTGHRLVIEVLVTFLPKMVLDSVFQALRIADLTPSNITLEPIAAIRAIIPEDMRQLNLALIDVGAGTTDIAITQNGTVTAYGMVPFAGDELTEEICDHYLADFTVGERIKQQLSDEETVSFKDIFGRDRTEKRSDILKTLAPKLREGADLVSQEIKRLNQDQTPRGVVLIGGGSLIPGITEQLHQSLGLKEDDIGHRTPGHVQSVVDHTGSLLTPQFVTPIGIALVTAERQGLQFAQVTVNRKSLQVLNLLGAITVRQVLDEAGISLEGLVDKTGPPLRFMVNGMRKKINGNPGEPARIVLNGQPTDPDAIVSPGDEIQFIPAEPGETPSATIKQIADKVPKIDVNVNGRQYQITPLILKDGKEVDIQSKIEQDSNIEVRSYCTVRQALDYIGESADDLQREVCVTFNRKPLIVKQSEFVVSRGPDQLTLDAKLNSGDAIVFTKRPNRSQRLKDILEKQLDTSAMNITLNDKPLVLPNYEFTVLMNGEKVTTDSLVEDGAEIETIQADQRIKVLSHLFKYLNLKPKENRGNNLVMRVDGENAGFTTPIKEGANVDIHWESKKFLDL